jgi:hypothetical protein
MYHTTQDNPRHPPPSACLSPSGGVRGSRPLLHRSCFLPPFSLLLPPYFSPLSPPPPPIYVQCSSLGPRLLIPSPPPHSPSLPLILPALIPSLHPLFTRLGRTRRALLDTDLSCSYMKQYVRTTTAVNLMLSQRKKNIILHIWTLFTALAKSLACSQPHAVWYIAQPSEGVLIPVRSACVLYMMLLAKRT